MSDSVTLCECFARDGLQHEPDFVPTERKIELIDAFSALGFKRVEATSYSRPDVVPAFADCSDVLAGITRHDGVHYKATCANVRAVERAVADFERGAGATEISLLVSASESHSQRNLRRSRADQWDNVAAMVAAAGGRFRLVGSISAALGCPFEGAVDQGVVVEDVRRFVDLGVQLVCIGDTTGLGTPVSVKALFRRILGEVPDAVPIAHFHNSRGTAIANCVAAYEAGARMFDSAFGGVGGHPTKIQYGAGVTGNVATEDLVNIFESMGISTGLDLDRLIDVSRRCEEILACPLHSMVARTGLGLIARQEAFA